MSDLPSDIRDRIIETHTMVKALVLQVSDHETRIRKNENVATRAMAFAVVIAALIPSLISHIYHKIIGG